MAVEILLVGRELLLGRTPDANAVSIARALDERGIPLSGICVVGDVPDEIAAAIRAGLARASLLLVIGGLGATQDDVTREGVAKALGLALRPDDGAVTQIRTTLACLGRPPSRAADRMGILPEGAEVMPNPAGLAPAFLLRSGKSHVVVLPGVPAECAAIFEASVLPLLAGDIESRGLARLHLAGINETRVEEEILGLLRVRGISHGLYPHEGEVTLVLEGPNAADVLAAAGEIEKILGEYVVGRGDATIEGRILDLLVREGKILALAESASGGKISDRIVRIPGASRAFRGGVVAYADEVKRDLLGVPAATLAEFGAVSRETARAMAEGVRRVFAADYGLAVTGIAGPGGGSQEKPVGLHFMALAAPEGTAAEERRYIGDRDAIRRRSATDALNLLRRYLLQKRSDGHPETRP